MLRHLQSFHSPSKGLSYKFTHIKKAAAAVMLMTEMVGLTHQGKHFGVKNAEVEKYILYYYF